MRLGRTLSGPGLVLWLLLAVVVVAQPISDLVARRELTRLQPGVSAYEQLQRYQRVHPEVLFIGNSRIRADIDTGALAAAISARRGVGKIGIDGSQPTLDRAVVDRVLAVSPRPRTVVIGVSEFDFNLNGIFADPSENYWELDHPADPGFMWRSLALAPDPVRLAKGWVVPLYANYPILLEATRCSAHDSSSRFARVASSFAFGTDRPPCGVHPDNLAHVMNAVDHDQVLGRFRTQLLNRYRVSQRQTDSLDRSIRALRAAGIEVRLLVTPSFDIQRLLPDAESEFRRAIEGVASATGVPVTDDQDIFADRPELFSDPSHLDSAGRTLYTTRLAALLGAPG